MIIKNPALIEYYETNELTEDMEITALELSLDQNYDFDEVRAIQEMFNISYINIKELSPIPYEDFGLDDSDEYFDPFATNNDLKDKSEKCLYFISELRKDNVKNLSFYWDKKEFDIKNLEGFRDLEITTGVNSKGSMSFQLQNKNDKAVIYTGKDDILAYTTTLESEKIDFQDINKAKTIRISRGQDIDEILKKVNDIIPNIEAVEFTSQITLDDIDKLAKKNIKALSTGALTLRINNVSELSPEKLKDLCDNKNIPIKNIEIYSETNNFHQNQAYDIDTYVAIHNELSELLRGIDDNLSEKEIFAEVYKRVSTSIVYDIPAAYPETPEEEKYKEAVKVDCRNLKNALLYKKAVCAGYADVLRNALAMKGIESLYISGPIDSKISLKALETPRYKNCIVLSRDEEKGIAEVREYHAWNKVKLGGKWYNTDPTWDRNELIRGKVPQFALKSDEEFEKIGRTEIPGPSCTESLEKKYLNDIVYGKHVYIGDYPLPNSNELKNYWANAKKLFIEASHDLKRNIGIAGIKIKNYLNNVKSLNEPGRTNPSDILPNASNSNAPKRNAKTNSWDLQNWGISNKNINDKINNIDNQTNQIDEKNKNLEENERE